VALTIYDTLRALIDKATWPTEALRLEHTAAVDRAEAVNALGTTVAMLGDDDR
jgi:hypothetical protein